MSESDKLALKGLYTYSDKYHDVPDGALLVADNINIDKTDVATPRKGFLQVDYSDKPGVTSFGVFQGKMFAHGFDTLWYASVTGTGITGATVLSSSVNAYNSGVMRFATQNQNLYMNSDQGAMKLDDVPGGTFRKAGAPRGRSLVLTPKYDGPGIVLLPGKSRAYRLVWGYKDINGNLILGAPSERAVILDPVDGNNWDVTIVSDIPLTVTTTEWFYQLYRTREANIDEAGDVMALVYEAQLTGGTGGDLANGHITISDITPDSLMGADLYTNDTQEGAAYANTEPPACVDLVSYQNYMFYGNTRQKDFLSMTLIGSLVVGNKITIVSGATSKTLTGSETPTTDLRSQPHLQTSNSQNPALDPA